MKSMRLPMGILGASALALSSLIAAQAQDRTSATSADAMSQDWRENCAYAVGLQAVIYGLPAVKNLNMRYSMVETPSGDRQIRPTR